jgi:hypothetical protein
MGTAACTLFEAELALDRLEAELATELPAHLRAFAAAYAAGSSPPAAPSVARRAASVAIAQRALPHPLLADRALGLLRLLAPIAIEDDPAVARALGQPATWDALRVLGAARDQAARARFGLGAVELIHRLHGSRSGDAPNDLSGPPPPVDGWSERGTRLPDALVVETWDLLATRHGARGTMRVAVGEAPRPRAFVVEPQVEVIVVLPRVIDAPAARFAVLHELGHALANLLAPAGLPRALDEAAASYVARLLEVQDALPGWYEPDAAGARARRTAIAAALDRIECELPVPSDLPAEKPPWALWHDPGAQAAYVTAEVIAARLWAALGPVPEPGALADALAVERDRIDRVTVI